jgi:hypothetical protein
MATHDTPTGAADSCLLELEGGDAGILKLKLEAEATTLKSEAAMGRKGMTWKIFGYWMSWL